MCTPPSMATGRGQNRLFLTDRDRPVDLPLEDQQTLTCKNTPPTPSLEHHWTIRSSSGQLGQREAPAGDRRRGFSPSRRSTADAAGVRGRAGARTSGHRHRSRWLSRDKPGTTCPGCPARLLGHVPDVPGQVSRRCPGVPDSVSRMPRDTSRPIRDMSRRRPDTVSRARDIRRVVPVSRDRAGTPGHQRDTAKVSGSTVNPTSTRNR